MEKQQAQLKQGRQKIHPQTSNKLELMNVRVLEEEVGYGNYG